MRRRTRFSLEPKYILAICSVLCIILIFVSVRYEDKIQPVKNVVTGVFTPMQKGINTVGNWITDKMELLKNIKDLQKENKELQEQLAETTYENRILQQEGYELDTLRDLYELDKRYPSYPKVAATIISKDTNNWYSRFVIDKGSDDGLKVGMNVLAGNGLVGIIIDVGHNNATVRSIIDDANNVSGMFLKTNDQCNVKGNLELIDNGMIEVQGIDKDAKVKDGYEVVTSTISPKYLQGILIGYVSDITLNSDNLTMSGYLTPAVDFSNLTTVLVITELKEALY
ncbi:rod shape-determining protein MreC [Anaerosporobacter faecicola]|uniref:rod shape-determining protein MreC n=1 Tax=Anaerosporobacter faecicola TaxID=2718714 RepID=UPI00143B3152|nr:rod shape-determining protein MreC [Anaerosporobacter faecicola]